MRRLLLLLGVLLCLFTFDVYADDNYDAYVPNCIALKNNKLIIPVEFSIRNSNKFTSTSYGKIHLMDLREDVSCIINSYESDLFDNIILDNNYLYGVLKEEYSNGEIPSDIYNSSYIDGNFDYDKYSTSLVLECINDSDNNIYILNDNYDNLVIGDETYCNHANSMFNKEYNIIIEKEVTPARVFIESIETANDNPDILYIVLLVTLTLLFFFILLEVKRQNKYVKKRK